MKKIATRAVIILTGVLLFVYLLICGYFYVKQESILFRPDSLEANYEFHFDQPFEEMNLKMSDDALLNGLLFKADSSKGLIFYLHGNGGALDRWGDIANTYTQQQYDFFILDYRGYGKSEGKIRNQKQFFSDAQTAYNELGKTYSEKNIVIIGYSMGTGPAAYLGATNHPKMVVLQAPYYNMIHMMHTYFPILPSALLKYKLRTDQYLQNCEMPVVVFHGNADELIPFNSSLMLQELFKEGDQLFVLEGQGHNGMTANMEYQNSIIELLNN